MAKKVARGRFYKRFRCGLNGALRGPFSYKIYPYGKSWSDFHDPIEPCVVGWHAFTKRHARRWCSYSLKGVLYEIQVRGPALYAHKKHVFHQIRLVRRVRGEPSLAAIRAHEKRYPKGPKHLPLEDQR